MQHSTHILSFCTYFWYWHIFHILHSGIFCILFILTYFLYLWATSMILDVEHILILNNQTNTKHTLNFGVDVWVLSCVTRLLLSVFYILIYFVYLWILLLTLAHFAHFYFVCILNQNNLYDLLKQLRIEHKYNEFLSNFKKKLTEWRSCSAYYTYL